MMKLKLLHRKNNLLLKLLKFLDEKGESLDLANTNADVYLKFDREPQDYAVALMYYRK